MILPEEHYGMSRMSVVQDLRGDEPRQLTRLGHPEQC